MSNLDLTLEQWCSLEAAMWAHYAMTYDNYMANAERGEREYQEVKAVADAWRKVNRAMVDTEYELRRKVQELT